MVDTEHSEGPPPPGEEGFEKKNRKRMNFEVPDTHLQITSLMDIMTILLVFLLVSITSDPLNIQQGDDLVLAKSTAQYKPEDSIPVTINKKSILADDKLVAEVSCKIGAQPCRPEDHKRRVYCKQPEANCDPAEKARLGTMYYYVDDRFKKDQNDKEFLIEPLHRELQQLVKQQRDENEQIGRKFAGRTTVICDKDIPFRLLTEVVYSAGKSELFDIRFAIIKSGTR